MIWSLNSKSNFKMQRWLICIIWHSIRASTSVDAKSCKMQKILHFTHFDPKNTHISGCKIVHKCTIATVTVHICTVNVALAFNILVIFSLFLSLACLWLLTLTSLSHFLISSNHQTIRSLANQSVDLATATNQSVDIVSGFLVVWWF